MGRLGLGPPSRWPGCGTTGQQAGRPERGRIRRRAAPSGGDARGQARTADAEPVGQTKKSPPVSPEGASKRRSAVALADDLQVLGRALAVAALDEFVLHPLPLAQAVVPSPLDGRDVNERVGTPTVRLNESIAFGGVEPLHSSGLQRTHPHVQGVHAGQPRHDARPNANSRGLEDSPRMLTAASTTDLRENIVRCGPNHKRRRLCSGDFSRAAESSVRKRATKDKPSASEEMREWTTTNGVRVRDLWFRYRALASYGVDLVR